MAGIKKIVIVFLIIFLLSFYPIGADTKMKFWNTINGYKIYQILDGNSNSFIVEFDNIFIMIDTGSRLYFTVYGIAVKREILIKNYMKLNSE